MSGQDQITQNWRGLAAILPLGVFRHVLGETDRFVFINPALAEMLGYSEEELLTMPAGDIFNDSGVYRALIDNVREQGTALREEVSVRAKSRQEIFCFLSLTAVRDPGGAVTGIDGVLQDISQTRRAAKDLKESKELFQIVFNNFAAAIVVADKHDKITAWNPLTEQMLGWQRGELFNKPMAELYSAQAWEQVRDEALRQNSMLSEREAQVYRKDGRLLDVSISLSFIHDSEGERIGWITMIRDITEQKKARQMLLQAKIAAEEASTTKSLFLANVSHEVRTPMNTILGIVDLTLDGSLTPEQRDNLMTIKTAGDVLLSLINDILDLSRVEAGKVQLENIELNISHILHSVCKGLSILARNKNLELVWEVDPQVPETLGGDPIRLRQILVNLINNAIKFAFHGQIVIKVRALAVGDGMCEMRFSVRDEGVGIPREKLQSIFEPFTQADASTARRFGGTGLGLAISKRLVEMMQGRMWVESEEFKGSIFYFTVKLRIAEKTPSASPPPDPAAAPVADAPGKDVKNLYILLAEDNIVNQKIAARMLEKKGWRVKGAENGKQVLEYLEQEPFDLILMDAQMPFLDGFETTRLIRESEKKNGRHIPIVALTAHAMASDRQKCLDTGMDDYVSKPIDRQKLYAAIENLF